MKIAPFTPLKEKYHVEIGKPQGLFPALRPMGRKIVFGFSYVERVGRGSNTRVWFSPSLKEDVADRIKTGDMDILTEFHVDWAAVRQFELLQHGSNFQIYPMEICEPEKAFQYMGSMRSGGMRLTVITMGRYENPQEFDELRLLDERLQKTIADFISMIFLEEQSAETSAGFERLAEEGKWNFAEALPHVAQALGASMLFRPARSVRAEKRFFQLLEMLPPQKIRHDVAVGLELPEFSSRHQFFYYAAWEKKYFRFQQALTDVFRSFDGLSMHELDGRAGPATDKVMATMRHMRGYGDHMRPETKNHYAACAAVGKSLVNGGELKVA
jgi:hypothetical protein